MMMLIIIKDLQIGKYRVSTHCIFLIHQFTINFDHKPQPRYEFG